MSGSNFGAKVAQCSVQINRQRFATDEGLQNAHGFWGVVSWIQKQFPNVNLTSPPEFAGTASSAAKSLKP
jgi:hypothetical protein